MKRNSMLTKIIAVLLCALMVAAWLPKTSAAANDFESGMDRIYGTDAANAMPLVIGTNADSGLANAYYAYTPAEDGTLTLTAEDGTTFTVNGVAYTDAVAVTADTKYIIVATNEAKAYSFTAAFEVAPTGPVYNAALDIKSTSLSFQDYIMGQFVYNNTAIKKEAFDEVYMMIVPLDEGSLIKETRIDERYSANVYVYKYGFWSRCMADDVAITLYGVKDGTTYCGSTIEWSVQQQAMGKIEEYTASGNAAMVTLYVDMLNFGSAIQDNNSYRTDDLANGKLTDAQKACATQTSPELNITAPEITKKDYELQQLALYTSDRTGLQIVFRMPSGWDKTAYTVAATVDGTTTFCEFSTKANTTANIIYSNLKANEMRKTVSFQLYCNGEPVNDIVYNVSIATVAKLRIDSGKMFAEDLMKYGDSVALNFPA